MSEPDVLDLIRPHLPPARRPTTSPSVNVLYSLIVGGGTGSRHVRRFHLLYAGAGRLARTLDLDEALRALEVHVDFAVAAGARRRLFIRGGAIGWNGRAIVLAGHPSGGTSTLLRAMVRAGATAYSDPYAVFDERGRIRSYMRPVAEHGPVALPVAVVAFSDYREGATLAARPLSSGQTVLALLERTVQARLRPAFALETFARAISGSVAIALIRGEASEAVQWLLTIADASS